MWHEKVLCQFGTVPEHANEKDYYGPYNKLLHSLFPIDSDFVVNIQFIQNLRSALIEHISVWYEVLLVDRPVLVLQVNPPRDLFGNFGDFGRQNADKDLRIYMADVVTSRFRTCPLDTFYAVSIFGTRLCFYSVNTRETEPMILPQAIQKSRKVRDTTPLSQWAYDILEPEGEERFRQLVEEIKVKCGALIPSHT